MNILAAGDAPIPLSALIVPLLLGAGAAAAMATGVFRRASIVGPNRIEDNQPLEPLSIAMGIGLMVYFLGQTVAAGGPGGAAGPATAPATQPALTETAVLVELISRLAAVAVMFILLLLLYRRSRTGGSAFRRLGLSPDRIPRGIASGAAGLFMVVPLMILALLATSMAMGPQQQYVHPFLKMFEDTHDEAGRDVILVSILAAAPVSEELFFRVCLQTLIGGWLARRQPRWPSAPTRWIAVVLTSIVFALAHGDWWAMPPIFVLSLCLGYAYERTGNVWTSITIHAAFNAWQLWMFQMKF
jgi:membrane protease YdiL (CAAX protease family)